MRLYRNASYNSVTLVHTLRLTLKNYKMFTCIVYSLMVTYHTKINRKFVIDMISYPYNSPDKEMINWLEKTSSNFEYNIDTLVFGPALNVSVLKALSCV